MLTQKVKDYLEQLSHWIGIVIAFMIPISTALASILFLIAVGLSICIGRWRVRFLPLINHPVVLIFCAFYGLFLMGSLYSSATDAEVIQMLLKFSKFFLAIFLIPLFTNRCHQKYAIYAFLTAMLITMILSYLKVMGVLHFNMQYTGAAVFKSHIETNFLMAITAYLVAYQSLTQTRYRFLWILFLILLVVNILFMSAGRSGYIVFFALLTLFLWQQFKWRGCLLASLCIIVLSIAAYTLSPEFKTRTIAAGENINQYVQGDTRTSVGARLRFAKNSFLLIKAHPLLGTGTGSFETEYKKLVTDSALQTSNPHNEYLNITAQFGLIGFMLLCCLFYIPWRRSYMLSPSMQVLAQGIIVAIFIGSFANSWLMDTTEGNLFVYFLVLAFAQYHYKHSLSKHIKYKQADK